MKSPVGRVDYTAHGIQRSGNHAVINWILGHFNSWVFYNCCLVENGSVEVEQENLHTHGVGLSQVRLASFEDMPERIEEIGATMQGATQIIVLRDFYNTYASRFEKRRMERSPYWVNKRWDHYDNVGLWKSLATRFLREEQKGEIRINYNLWFVSDRYRRSLSNNFGEFTDRGVQHVPYFGGGSSFDCQRYDGRASEMDVLKRWVRYYGDEEYAKKILADEEAREMNRKIFGSSPPRIHI